MVNIYVARLKSAKDLMRDSLSSLNHGDVSDTGLEAFADLNDLVLEANGVRPRLGSAPFFPAFKYPFPCDLDYLEVRDGTFHTSKKRRADPAVRSNIEVPMGVRLLELIRVLQSRSALDFYIEPNLQEGLETNPRILAGNRVEDIDIYSNTGIVVYHISVEVPNARD